MSKKIILVLIGVMSVAIIGLIVVQSYWIKNTYSAKEQQFRVHAHRTLGQLFRNLRSRKLSLMYWANLTLTILTVSQWPVAS
jgi:two-component system, OmpR family, phosphate regulon sensor histidine kinase PhoR